MSWISENYEKAALGAAVVIGIGLAVSGYSRHVSVKEELDLALRGTGNNDPSVVGAEKVQGALNSLSSGHAWEQAVYDQRPVNLFTGVPLFARRDSSEPVDLVKSPPVHEPIPNVWWLGYDLDPGFSDSPQRDPDEDGFTNLEEFHGQTDPTDAKSYPPLIAKLSYVRDESTGWLLEFSSDIGEGQYQFKYEHIDPAGGRAANRSGYIGAGTAFFESGAAEKRFELVEVKDVERKNERTGIMETIRVASIRDLKPNKQGQTFEVPRRMRNPKDFIRFDRTAVLALQAIGQGANEFKVEENTTFALPAGAASQDYRLVSVTPESIEVEYPTKDGGRATVTIPKGGLPQIPR